MPTGEAGGEVTPLNAKIRSQDYGLPMACPTLFCGFRWLKLPGVKMRKCPNCQADLVSMRKKNRHKKSK